MICLDPPYSVINGYTVLSDHADPELFYVLPAAPALGELPGGNPAFSLVQYQGGGAGIDKVEGGLLTLTTTLGVPDDDLAAVSERLSQTPGISAPGIRVLPVGFTDGTVELIALGSTSLSSGSDPPGERPFEVDFVGSGRPSLGGDNRATFQLVLDAAGAELVERALDAPDLPIIAVYRMSFVGLRPSFQVEISADWSRIYSTLREQARLNAHYAALDVENMVNRALEENSIEIDTTVFGPGEVHQAAAERARRQLVDWVLERMFRPMVDTETAASPSIARIIDDTVFSLTRAVLPGLSYRLRQLDDNQLRLMSARMDEAVAEVREVVPQGSLGGLIREHRVDEEGAVREEWTALRDQLVMRVPLAGFPRLEVRVASQDRFAEDGLSSVQVDMARCAGDGERTAEKSIFLRDASQHDTYIINLLGSAEVDLASPYLYRVKVVFDPAGPYGPHPPVQSPWREGHTTELVVEPRDLYRIRDIRVGAAPTFSFGQYPAVSVDLRCGTCEGGVTAHRIQLTPDEPLKRWRFRSFSGSAAPFEYRVTYHRPAGAGGPVTSAWREQVDDWLTVSDPMPLKRPVNVVVSLPWEDVIVAFLRLRYDDEEHGVHHDEQVDLDEDTQFFRRDLPVANTRVYAVSYRLTVLFTSGELLEGSWRTTDDERIIIDRALVDRRAVKVQLIGGGLAANGLSEVTLALRVCDPDTGRTRAETTYVFTPDNEDEAPAAWEYLLGSPPLTTVDYRAVFVDRDGFAERISWTPTTSDLLVVNLRTRRVLT